MQENARLWPISLASRCLARRPELPYEVAAIALVAVYGNAFEVWQVLTRSLGRVGASLVPLAALAALAVAAAAIAVVRGRRGLRIRLAACLVAAGLAALAALAADPMFPAKRIHVAEYAVLAWVVGRIFAPYLRGAGLLAATAFATAVLGSHDELIQGLYPGRTYGLRDVLVNALSGLAGAVLVYAFEQPGGEPQSRPHRPPDTTQWAAFAVLAIGWLLLLLALPAFRGDPVPLWPVLPLAAGAVAWLLISAGAAPAGDQVALRKIAVWVIATGFYPLLSHAFALDIH